MKIKIKRIKMKVFQKILNAFSFQNNKLPKNIDLRDIKLRQKIVSLTSYGSLNLQNGKYITEQNIDLRRERVNNYVFANK